MAAPFSFGSAADALELFDRGTDGAVLLGLRRWTSVAHRYAVTEAMITGGGKAAPVDATRVTVRSGAMRRAISPLAPSGGGGEYTAGLAVDTSSAPHFLAHEFGVRTSPHTILPRRARVLSWIDAAGGRAFARRVNHPGSNIPPRPVIGPTMEATGPAAAALVEEELAELATKVLRTTVVRDLGRFLS